MILGCVLLDVPGQWGPHPACCAAAGTGAAELLLDFGCVVLCGSKCVCDGLHNQNITLDIITQWGPHLVLSAGAVALSCCYEFVFCGPKGG